MKTPKNLLQKMEQMAETCEKYAAEIQDKTSERAIATRVRADAWRMARHMSREYMLETYAKAVVMLGYWEGVTDCTCSDETPIGACLRCDIKRTLNLINPT